MIEGLLSPLHLLVIGGIALFVFGPTRLPELGRAFGQAIRGFKTGLEEIHAAGSPPLPTLQARAEALPRNPVPATTSNAGPHRPESGGS